MAGGGELKGRPLISMQCDIQISITGLFLLVKMNFPCAFSSLYSKTYLEIFLFLFRMVKGLRDVAIGVTYSTARIFHLVLRAKRRHFLRKAMIYM